MTQVGGSLDPIGPNQGEVGGDMQSQGVEAVDGHEAEGIKNGDGEEERVSREGRRT